MPKERHRKRWNIAALLAAGVLVNYFDRVNLSVTYQHITQDFGLSTVAFGYLLSAYSWTYAACQLPAGALLDRFGVKLVGRVSTFLWCIASALSAVSLGPVQFFLSRLLLGVGEAPTFPGNAKAVARWFDEDERGLATACFDSSAKIASAIGLPIMGLLVVRAGWRWTFAATAVVSLLYFVAFTAVYRDPEATTTTRSRDPYTGVPIANLLTHRKIIGLALGSASYNYCFYLLLTWLPGYLGMSLHLDLLHSTWYIAIPWLVATFTDMLFGGWMVDALIRRGIDSSRVRQAVLIGGTFFGIAIFGAGTARTPGMAVFWISVSIGGLSAAAPVLWSLPGLVAPPGSVGRVGGIMNFANQIAAIVAPIATGYVVSVTHSFKAAFWMAAALLGIGILAYTFLLGKIQRLEFSNS